MAHLDPTRGEMMERLAKTFAGSLDDTYGGDFDIEAAIYWFANDYHSGQTSNLYSALSMSNYKPGLMETGIEYLGDLAGEMYQFLVENYTK